MGENQAQITGTDTSIHSSQFPGPTPINPANTQNPLFQFGDLDTSTPGAWTFTSWDITPSKSVGLSPQLVSYDIYSSIGVNLRFNDLQTVAPGDEPKVYTWYAGVPTPNNNKQLQLDASGRLVAEAAEFGSANLLNADPLGQGQFGLIAGMIIEPAGSQWDKTPNPVKTYATINDSNNSPLFQDYALLFQDYVAALGFSAIGSVNYGSEPMKGTKPIARQKSGNSEFGACAYSNLLVASDGSTTVGPPQTPIVGENLTIKAGAPVRLRVMQPFGSDQHVFQLAGHVWQEEPYQCDYDTTSTPQACKGPNNGANTGSKVIGKNDTSQWQGTRMGLSAADRFDIVLDSAGGTNKVPGDYLYNSFPGGDIITGMWGVMRVANEDGILNAPFTTPVPSYCQQ